MPCCGRRRSGPTVPVTSADVAVEGNGPVRFQVATTDGVHYFATYRQAQDFRRAYGGRLTVTRS